MPYPMYNLHLSAWRRSRVTEAPEAVSVAGCFCLCYCFIIPCKNTQRNIHKIEVLLLYLHYDLALLSQL